MNSSIAITPEFSDYEIRSRLLNKNIYIDQRSIREIKKNFSLFDLQEPIDSLLRYELFHPSIADTLPTIKHANMHRYRFCIDLTSRGKIHPSFIKHYAKTVIQEFRLRLDSLPIRWENLRSNIATRRIHPTKLSW